MKTLYLVRHAKSSWELDYLDDFERPLNERGKRDAPLMGRVLRDRVVRPDLVLSSPAARAASTARILAEGIGYPRKSIFYTERLYDAGVTDLLEVINALDDAHGSAMIVSHNPGLSTLAGRLDTSFADDMPTAGVVALELSVENWGGVAKGCGRLLFADFPKNYRS